jgi:hypothetical protein
MARGTRFSSDFTRGPLGFTVIDSPCLALISFEKLLERLLCGEFNPLRTPRRSLTPYLRDRVPQHWVSIIMAI